MHYRLLIVALVFLLTTLIACNKENNNSTIECSDAVTTRQIVNRTAVVKITATVTYPIYLVEQGAIDTKLIPCSIPNEFMQNNLQVVISGDVKSTPQIGPVPCCIENIVITKITR